MSANDTTHRIEHDGFEGTIIGSYVTREGKRGVVLQQVGTKVVHVYGEKWFASAPPAMEAEAVRPATNIGLEIAARYLKGAPGIFLAKEITNAITAERASPPADNAVVQALREAKDALTTLDDRLFSAGALHTAEDAYDSFYRGVVADALISIEAALGNQQ